MTNLNLLKTFSKVAELGSFSKAADDLRQPKSRVSRSISRLEQDLGVQLIRRTTRHTALTTTGQQFYRRIHLLIRQLEEEVDQLTSSTNDVTGELRITAPEDFAQTVLTDLISTYLSRYPKVEVRSFITNDFIDLAKDNIDIAFRIGLLKDSNLVQRKLFSTHLLMVASPDYIKSSGRPTVLPDLKKHRLLIFRDFLELLLPTLSEKSAKSSQIIRSDSFPMLLKLTLQDKGIAILPSFFCKKNIENGELVRVMPQWQGQEANVNIVYSPTKNLAPRTRTFIDLACQQNFQ